MGAGDGMSTNEHPLIASRPVPLVLRCVCVAKFFVYTATVTSWRVASLVWRAFRDHQLAYGDHLQIDHHQTLKLDVPDSWRSFLRLRMSRRADR